MSIEKTTSTNSLFVDLVDLVEARCVEEGVDNILDIVEDTVCNKCAEYNVAEKDCTIFMYQIAYTVTMRLKWKSELLKQSD